MDMLSLIYQLFIVLPLLLTEIFGIMLIYTVFKNDKEAKNYLFKLVLGGASILSIYLMKLVIPMTNPFLSSPIIEQLLIVLQNCLCLLVIFKLTTSLKNSNLIHRLSCISVLPFLLAFISLIAPLVSQF